MRHDECRRLTACSVYTLYILPTIINLLASLPRANAEVALPSPFTLTPRPFVTMPLIRDLEPVPNSLFPSQSPSITPLNQGQPPLETRPTLFIATEQPQQQVNVRTRVFNYYFLFLALLVAALATLLWYLHRQRRRWQEQLRLRGQLALVRDVERWALHRHNLPAVVEGLNECGEAPPPYKPKHDTITATEAESGDAITPPPRALSRENTGHIQLPDYVEMIRSDVSNRTTGHERTTSQTEDPSRRQ